MSKFQIALMAVFGFFILAAVLVFSLYRGGASSSSASITVWGSMPASAWGTVLNNAPFNQDKKLLIRYVEKEASSLADDFTEALAQGQGPDLIVLSDAELWQSRNKLLAIPYGSISERTFKEMFAEGGEVFLSPVGIYALPLALDPMVLYYNRDILSAAGIAKPLAFWDEIYTAASKLTLRDAAGNITQSVMALGETRNIASFKNIFSLLLLQAGSPVTELVASPSGAELRSALLTNPGLPIAPAESALDFYTQFANPSKLFYSWNRTLPEAQNAFASGDVAYYLGLSSELPTIRRKAPTLNFALTSVPQSRVSGKTLTYGRIYGVAISRGTRNAQAALAAALKIVSAEGASALGSLFALPPARRDLLSGEPAGANDSIFYTAALQERSWLDPEPALTSALFQEAIESVTSGRLRTSEALNAANRKLEDTIRN